MHSFTTHHSIWLRYSWLLLWALLVISFVLTLPGFSQSDTFKYIAIAQEMLSRHEYLVPFWQGHPYTDKPPLLFWLFIAGWHIFGINQWWPQLLCALFATGSIGLTWVLARQLWPDNEDMLKLTPFILVGMIFWIWFSKQIRVDPILTFAILLGVSALIASAQGRKWGWRCYVIAVGVGGLCKGPVILMFVLLPGVLLPLWLRFEQISLKKWFGLLSLTTLLGVAIPLAWAIPAAIVGGQHFADAIFYGQIVHRAHEHKSHFDYYLLRLPFWLLPWTVFLPFWQGLFKINFRQDPGIKLCGALIVIDLAIFSLFGQKLPHYIYPLLALIALIIAHAISRVPKVRRQQQWPIAIVLLLLAGFLLGMPQIVPYLNLKTQVRAYFLADISLIWPVLCLGLALILALYRPRTRLQQLVVIVFCICFVDVFINSAILANYQHYFNTTSFLTQMRKLDQGDAPLGVYGDIHNNAIQKYIDDYPATVLTVNTLRSWIDQHPHGWVITAQNCLPLQLKGQHSPRAWVYQGRFSIVSVWQAGTLKALPDLCK